MQASRNTKHPLERARSIRSQRLHSWPDYEGPAFPRTELGAIPVVLSEGPFGVSSAIRGESCGWPLSARLSPLAPIPAEDRFPPENEPALAGGRRRGRYIFGDGGRWVSGKA